MDDILQDTFGHASFRGPQRQVMEHLLAGKHALVIMPTGMGKSLCYQIPALEIARREEEDQPRPLALVLSPLIALMKDQVDALCRRGVDAAFVNSSLNSKERQSSYQAIAAGEFDLLYVTPERFRKPEFLDVLSRRQVPLLAVDEAHCISEWGHDFRPDYTRLEQIRGLLKQPTTIALTATATPAVQQDIVRQLGIAPDDITLFHEGIARPNLELEVEQVWDDDERLGHIRRILAAKPFQQGSQIIYFTLIKTLERFSTMLTATGTPHVVYHGLLERGTRRRLQNAFMEGEARLVLATNAFGMGIDKEDIRAVIHAEVPGSVESYYQEIGRAGRDGKPSVCSLLYDQADLATQMEFIRWSNPGAQFYTELYTYLRDRPEEVQAHGTEWLNKQLHGYGKSDHRLETAFGMLHRYGVVKNDQPPGCFQTMTPLPEELADEERLNQKLERDQRKLLAMVEYVGHEGDRKAFLNRYFGLE